MNNPNELSYNELVKKIAELLEQGEKDKAVKYQKRLEFLKQEFAKGFTENPPHKKNGG